METQATLSPFVAPECHRALTAQLMPLVQDLAAHRPAIYWGDFLASAGLFWAAFGVFTSAAGGMPASAAALAVAVFALYRAGTFIHEIVHLPRAALPGFRWVWHLLCGIPILLPSFLYHSHIDHHAVRLYATRQDPEYLPFDKHPGASWALLLTLSLLSVPLLWLRFVLLVPLAWLSPQSRHWLDRHFSSLAIHLRYRTEARRNAMQRREQLGCEALTMLYAWTMTVLVACSVVPLRTAAGFVAAGTCVLLINAVRTRHAHRYRHDGQVSHAEQIEDSATLDRGAWFALFAPLGLRYHAAHHLFPYLPYHALGAAHRRLMQHPSAEAAVYRLTCQPRHTQGPASLHAR